MRRRLAVAVSVLFGVVPATYLVFWAVFFGVAAAVFAIVSPMELIETDVGVDWWRVVLTLLAAPAAVAGYVALLFAAKSVTSRRVALGLALGIAANLIRARRDAARER